MIALPVEGALLVVAHGCLFGTFLALQAYCARRNTEMSWRAQWYCLLAVALFPTTFFFRAAYSESLFILLVGLFLLGIARHWPLEVLAGIAGLATATRGPGVALTLPLVVYAWRRLEGRTFVKRGALVAGLAMLSCWGLLAFMAYQWVEFGDPLAFAKVQYYWVFRDGPYASLGEKVEAMGTLKPIWSVYLPSDLGYWRRFDSECWPIVSLQFANPIYFVGTIGLLVVGWRKRWLNQYELLLSAGLLAIPYVSKSYDSAMSSFGRFSAVVLPAYVVIGETLARLPRWLSIVILAAFGLLLCVYSALFGAGYLFI